MPQLILLQHLQRFFIDSHCGECYYYSCNFVALKDFRDYFLTTS